ncbi:hypothetical protein PP182_03890 [Maribacter sp. PR1]|uniref:Polysaccharide chain length determinant N-terminal domain-containing protein n=1 Tax=Maribacter cobaltidurans TaxID=1178778 RepID=A0ABU7IQM8_9FLAO|nr:MULTISPECIES: hypothetical protein [Maribacter]MDC6387807.1 hypothetical protein [Maribacter sp. PR1]MEE1975195.1 hypothetical protein [Maribacter cobaltidurans]
MAENQLANNQNSSDEIDLGQLFQLIGRGFNSIFRFILRVFLYLKRNVYILIGLVILGLAIGYGLTQIISKKLKIEVIVKPNMESKNYLYDVIDEIQSKIIAKDTLFFESIGVENIEFSGLKVEISRVVEEDNTENDLQYLELLQSFENTDAIADILRAELQNKSSFNHRITFFYNNPEIGNEFAKRLMDYINTNEYFDKLIMVYRENASSRIEANQKLLQQVDEIITNYTNGLAVERNNSLSERIVLDNQEQMNIADLFEYKNLLIKDIETKKLELEESDEPVSIINFGKSQVVQKAFFAKKIILIPLVLVSLFFLISFLTYLNRKSNEISE